VDVLSDLSLEDLHAAHLREGPLATVAVMDRPTSRRLLFDDLGGVGRADDARGHHVLARSPRGVVSSLAFAGVHVVSPDFLGLVTETGSFSILEPYMRLVGQGRRILPHRVDGCSWADVGRPEHLAAAERRLAAATPS
jgi:NDP-sugar pyrophosphorylase family protein